MKSAAAGRASRPAPPPGRCRPARPRRRFGATAHPGGPRCPTSWPGSAEGAPRHGAEASTAVAPSPGPGPPGRSTRGRRLRSPPLRRGLRRARGTHVPLRGTGRWARRSAEHRSWVRRSREHRSCVAPAGGAPGRVRRSGGPGPGGAAAWGTGPGAPAAPEPPVRGRAGPEPLPRAAPPPLDRAAGRPCSPPGRPRVSAPPRPARLPSPPERDPASAGTSRPLPAAADSLGARPFGRGGRGIWRHPSILRGQGPSALAGKQYFQLVRPDRSTSSAT